MSSSCLHVYRNCDTGRILFELQKYIFGFDIYLHRLNSENAESNLNNF